MEKNRQQLKSFKDLQVWQKAADLASLIYKITESFPNSELYGLTSQMRRAAVSVSSNLAEGFKRSHKKEKLQFYNIAYGSTAELESQVEIALRLNFLNAEDCQKLNLSLIEIGKMIDGLVKSTNGHTKSYILNPIFFLILLYSIFYILNPSTVAAATVGIGVNKNTFDLEIFPGGVHADELVVFNTSTSVSVPVHIQLNLWDLKEDSEDIEFITSEPALNATKWFSLSATDLIIEPDRSKDLIFSIAPPADASPGTYLVMMRFQAVLPEHYFEEVGPRAIPELGVIFFIKVPLLTLEGNKAYYSAEIVSIESPSKEGVSLIGKARANVFDDAVKTLIAKIKNTGIYYFKASGFLEIKNAFGATVYKKEIGERYLLPNRTRSLEIETLPPPPEKTASFSSNLWNYIAYQFKKNSYLGPYTATLTLSIPNEPPVVSTANFWVIPWKFWLPNIIAILAIFYLFFRSRHRLRDFFVTIFRGKPH